MQRRPADLKMRDNIFLGLLIMLVFFIIFRSVSSLLHILDTDPTTLQQKLIMEHANENGFLPDIYGYGW